MLLLQERKCPGARRTSWRAFSRWPSRQPKHMVRLPHGCVGVHLLQDLLSFSLERINLRPSGKQAAGFLRA